MKRYLAIITCIFLLPLPVLGEITHSKTSKPPIPDKCQLIPEEDPETGAYSETQLQQLVSQITVKVRGERDVASGTILAQAGNSYLVVTNSHVVRRINPKSLNIQTPDGKTHPAKLLDTNLGELDLAILEFTSNQQYCLPPQITNFDVTVDTPVMAGGYPSAENNIVFRPGTVRKIVSQPSLKEGYEIGYDSDIEPGMSGGAILSAYGFLLGINGMSQYPILNLGYVRANGQEPTAAEIEEWRQYSWGIPVSGVLDAVKPEVLTAYGLPQRQLPPLPQTEIPGYQLPEAPLTGWLRELEKQAKQITVRIDSSSQNNGSGVIIAKEGNSYTVLTAAHVVCEKKGMGECPQHTYTIVTADGQTHRVEPDSIQYNEGVDLAVVKFRSNQTYAVATLAKYPTQDNQYMLTAGYPRLGTSSPWRLTLGQTWSRERGLFNTTLSSSRTNNEGGLQAAGALDGGYELVYSSITYGGMSGGPVLDTQGRVIGIHGLAEGVRNIAWGYIQIGNSLGIPISTFLALAPGWNTRPQRVEDTPPRELIEGEVFSIVAAILLTPVPQENADPRSWIERGNQLWRLRRYDEAVQAFERAIAQKPEFFIDLAYYGKGLALGSGGQLKEAAAALELAVKAKPDFVPAWIHLSAVYRELQQLDKALTAINQAIKLEDGNPNLYNVKSVVLSDLKRYGEAELAINQAINLSPRPGFYNNRGTVYYNQQKWDLALADYTQAIAINPNHANAYNNRGGVYRNQQKWDLALADFNQAIAINPNLAEPYVGRGNVYNNQQKWDLALADYTQAIAINPNLALAYNNRGTVYYNQQKWDLALADYTQAIAINPNLALAYYNRGVVYLDQQKWDLAVADYNQAIAINPNLAEPYVGRGNVYADLQKWDLALADYTQAIAINPNYALAYYNRGNVYADLQKWDLALADYTQAIGINPNDANAYYGRGNVYLNQQKWDLALADFNQAIAINPNYAQAYSNRGIVYLDQQKWDLALADYTQAIAINPNYANAYNNRGIVYRNLQKWDLAVADFNQAIAINPNDADAYIWRGLVYADLQKWDLAVADYTQAIAINPNYALAYYNRGIVYRNLQKWDLAVADYSKAIEINPNYADAYYNRGLVYADLQKWDLAVADYTQAIAINPNDAQAYYNRGGVYYNQQKWDLAVADYTQAIAINPNDADAYIWRGLVYSDLQKWDLAVADYSKAIAINPNLGQAYYNRGNIYLKLGNINKAREDLQRAAQLYLTQGNTANYEDAIRLLNSL